MMRRLRQVNAVPLVRRAELVQKCGMPERVPILVDATQFPEAVTRDLLESFKARRLNHKFLYSSYRQAAKWLKLHEAYSPARRDAECERIYDSAFADLSKGVSGDVHVIGLGCGGGQKDARLLQLLLGNGSQPSYTPVDVSMPLVVTAYERARSLKNVQLRTGIVCDLGTASDLNSMVPEGRRLFAFFGMLPNFEPRAILPRITRLLRGGDWLLFSANLAPENDYRAGVEKVFPQYANSLTDDWLLAFLKDFGVDESDGKIEWQIEGTDLLRICAEFRFQKNASVECEGKTFKFLPTEKIRLFFSYRYAAETLHPIFHEHGLRIEGQWITPSQEEGVFVARRY
jgi:L-histidine Nalpha-methyltransferase